jgi:uncharacterized RDD family membrane protein YckC
MCLGALPGFILFIVGVGFAASSSGTRGAESLEAGAVGMVILSYGLIFLGILAVWLYLCYQLGRDGATFGKKMMKIKVLDQQGQPLGFGKAFLRELVKYVLGSACFLLLLWPLWDEQKQGLQDKIFSTHVYDA